MRTDVTDTNWAKTTCDKMVGTTKNGQTVPNVGLEQVHEAEIHGASGDAVTQRKPSAALSQRCVCRVIRGEMEGQLLVF